MRVILLNDYGHIQGGAASVAVESALGLRAQGVDTSYFSGVAPLDGRFIAAGVRAICLGHPDLLGSTGSLATAVRGLANIDAARSFDKFLANFDPRDTVIHCHGWTKSLTPLIFRPALNRKFKVIITTHEYFLRCPNGGFFVFPKGHYCHHQPLSRQCLFTNCDPRRYGHKLWRFSRSVFQEHGIGLSAGLSGIIAVSQFALDTLREHGPLPNVPMAVIRNPVGVAKRPLLMPEETAPFAYVGRFSPEKGVRMLIDAAELLTKHPFLFIGHGELAAQLRRAFPRAEFPGWLPKIAALERLRHCKALIFPSVWNETFGLVVAEALAMGVPVVCSIYSGAAELIEHGRNGWLFDARRRNALPEILDAIVQGERLWSARIEAQQSYWKNPLTLEKHVAELMRFYEQVLAA